MKAIINGKIILPDRVCEGAALLFEETVVAVIPEQELSGFSCEEIIDAAGAYVSPGLIDVHLHGRIGWDTCDGDLEGLRQISRDLLQHGVTSWFPTTMSVAEERVGQIFAVIRDCIKESLQEEWGGAQVLGANMEGPYINPKRCGAQRADAIVPPNAAFVKEYADVIRLLTVAPEVEGALEFIREITADTDIVCSLGHGDATYEEAVAGIEAGARHITHLFNAMSPMEHRRPGMAGAGLMSDKVYTELICDTFHIHPQMFKLVAELKKDKLILISDCIRAGGLTDGEYELGGQRVTVRGIECRLEDGVIAGSILSLDRAVANLARYTDLSLAEVIAAASLNPAMALGIADRKGSLRQGRDADILLLSEDLIVKNVWQRGRKVK